MSNFCYIGKKKECGCVVEWLPDMGDKMTARTVQELIDRDLEVTRVSIEKAGSFRLGRCQH